MEKIKTQKIVESINNCNFDTEIEYQQTVKKLPKFEESKLGGNPFAQKLVIPVTAILSDKDFVKDEEGVIVNKTMYSEKTQKVEIYIHENANSNIAGLSDKAQRLFLFILYSVQRKKDYIQLNTEWYMRLNKIKSYTTYSNAVKELIRYEYITQSCERTVYWINPYRFFPGSRLMKYPDNKEVVQEWDQNNKA